LTRRNKRGKYDFKHVILVFIRQETAMHHITLLAYPDCTTTGIYGFIDILSIANRWHTYLNQPENEISPLFKWDIVSIDGNPVQAEGRVTVIPHGSIHDIGSTDFILVPGFLPPLNFLGNLPKELTHWLRRRHQNNVLIGSTCSGTFLLAETGILDGKTVTTNFRFTRSFKKHYPSVTLKPERILTEDSGILCSGATTSLYDLSLYLIEKFGHKKLAGICRKMLMMEPRLSQSPYFIFDYQKDHADPIVKKVQSYMEENFSKHIHLESLANSFGTSPRHFARRFKKATGDSPLLYLQRIRVEAAKQNLEETMDSVDEITQQVGYEDPNSFRKLFKKNTGLLPREYRNRFTRRLKPVPEKTYPQ